MCQEEVSFRNFQTYTIECVIRCEATLISGDLSRWRSIHNHPSTLIDSIAMQDLRSPVGVKRLSVISHYLLDIVVASGTGVYALHYRHRMIQQIAANLFS